MPALLLIPAALILGSILRVAHEHWSRGNHIHAEPLPAHQALLVAAVDVLIDRPVALHHRRLAVVRANDARRAETLADARYQAMQFHPANHAARAAAMRRHPSAARVPVGA